MADSNASEAGYLQEHRELRTEIRQYLDWRAKSIQFALLLTAAAVAVAPELKSGPFFLVTALIIAFLWYDEARHLVAVFRLGTYLQLFVEPNVPGLNSETISDSHPVQRSIIGRAVANGVFPILYLLHTGLMVHYWTRPLRQGVLIIAGMVIVFIAVFSHSSFVALKGRQRELATWHRVRERVAAGKPND